MESQIAANENARGGVPKVGRLTGAGEQLAGQVVPGVQRDQIRSHAFQFFGCRALEQRAEFQARCRNTLGQTQNLGGIENGIGLWAYALITGQSAEQIII